MIEKRGKKLSVLLDKYVFKPYNISTEDLAIFRIIYCLFVIFLHGIPDYSWIGRGPSLLFFPPEVSIAALFNSFLPNYFFIILSLIIQIFFVFVLFGYRTKMSSIVLFVLLIIGHSFKYSFGKIDHDLFLIILPIMLSLSGWGDKYSIDSFLTSRKKRRKPWSAAWLALLFGFAMFTAGLGKFIGGWMNLSNSAVEHYALSYNIRVTNTPLLNHFFLNIDNPVFYEFLDWSVVIFEAGFLLMVIIPLGFRLFVVCALVFHIGNYLVLGISFSGIYLSICYLSIGI